MQTFVLIIISILALIVILYLANFNIEFKVTKNTDSEKGEKESRELIEKLSNTEMSILKHVSEGKSNQQIADELYLSVHTVKKHVSNIFKKLKIKSRTEARKFQNFLT